MIGRRVGLVAVVCVAGLLLVLGPTSHCVAQVGGATGPAGIGEAAPGDGVVPASPSKAPRIDFVRINLRGTSVVGGLAAPKSKVTVLADGKVVATIAADSLGEWVLATTYRFEREAPDLVVRYLMPSGLPGRALVAETVRKHEGGIGRDQVGRETQSAITTSQSVEPSRQRHNAAARETAPLLQVAPSSGHHVFVESDRAVLVPRVENAAAEVTGSNVVLSIEPEVVAPERSRPLPVEQRSFGRRPPESASAVAEVDAGASGADRKAAIILPIMRPADTRSVVARVPLPIKFPHEMKRSGVHDGPGRRNIKAKFGTSKKLRRKPRRRTATLQQNRTALPRPVLRPSPHVRPEVQPAR